MVRLNLSVCLFVRGLYLPMNALFMPIIWMTPIKNFDEKWDPLSDGTSNGTTYSETYCFANASATKNASIFRNGTNCVILEEVGDDEK